MFSVLDWTMGSITYLHDDAASHTYATKLKSAEFELILTSRLGIDLWQDLVNDPVFLQLEDNYFYQVAYQEFLKYSIDEIVSFMKLDDRK